MFSRAVYEGIRDHHRRFAERMRGDKLLPLGLLESINPPRIEITDYTIVSAGGPCSLHLSVTVPNGENARVRRTAVVPLVATTYGVFVPDLSARVTVTTDIAIHHGTPTRRGDMWHIEWSTAAPKTIA